MAEMGLAKVLFVNFWHLAFCCSLNTPSKLKKDGAIFFLPES